MHKFRTNVQQSNAITKVRNINQLPNEMLGQILVSLAKYGDISDLLAFKATCKHNKAYTKKLEPDLALIWAREQTGNLRVLLENLYIHTHPTKRGLAWIIEGIERFNSIEDTIDELERIGGLVTFTEFVHNPVIWMCASMNITLLHPVRVRISRDRVREQIRTYLLGAELVSMMPASVEAGSVWSERETACFAAIVDGLRFVVHPFLVHANRYVEGFTASEWLMRQGDPWATSQTEPLEALVNGTLVGGVAWLKKTFSHRHLTLQCLFDDIELSNMFLGFSPHYDTYRSVNIDDVVGLTVQENKDLTAMYGNPGEWARAVQDETARMALIKRMGWCAELPKRKIG